MHFYIIKRKKKIETIGVLYKPCRKYVFLQQFLLTLFLHTAVCST